MCMFSGPVHVSNTQIFVRAGHDSEQLVAYTASIDTRAPVAMILPIPVAPGSPDDAVRWIDLSAYPTLFSALDAPFVRPQSRGFLRSLSKSAPPPAPLAVVRVGAFVASFVPTIADFERLDPRFRLPTGVWAKLPAYAAYGFAVFELTHGAQRLHPIAFSFPRASPDKLFFPTVHVHDGEVSSHAMFDHALYLQHMSARAPSGLRAFEEASVTADGHVKTELTGGLVDPSRHVFKREIHGRHANTDQWV